MAVPVNVNDGLSPLQEPLADGQPAATLGGALPPARAVRPSAPEASPLPVWLWPAAVGLGGLGLLTANPMLTSVGVLVVPLIVSLLWRPGEPPILLACSMMQWLQVMTPVFHADLLGQPVGSVADLAMHGKATWLSLIGILAVAAGMRLALKHRLGSVAPQIERELTEFELSRLFYGYLAGYGLSALCGVMAWRLGGLTQLALAIGSLKWALLWMLLCCVQVQNRGYGLVAAVLLLESGVGFLGFWASFVGPFYILGLALFAIRKRQTLVVRLGVVLAVNALLILMVVWQAIKKEYRQFVSDGGSDQVVRVSLEARVGKLNQLLVNLNAESIEAGIISLVERVGYTELFASVLAWVPANEPHANGELLKHAVTHPLMPRLLFPNKAAIDDSEVTRRFTGITVSGTESGTSIGIGYMAECYADAGEFLMFLPLLLLGYLFGRVYRGMGFSGKSRVWGMALATATLLVTLQGIATAGSKLIGAILTTWLVLGAVNFFAGPLILTWLGRSSRTARSPQTQKP